jgi:(E)-4-hydroxy-3-methyl-but-2-enyl pyrophosphate reductase
MNVVRANVLGFCQGVRRAVDKIEAAVSHHDSVYSLGPIVHNERVAARLEGLGVRIVASLDEVPDGGAVAITAHGAEAGLLDRIAQRGLCPVDATCPIVRRAQETAAAQAAAGRFVVLYGQPSHPEVRGILSRTGGRGAATVSDDLDDSGVEPPLALLAQTTADPADFERFAESLRARFGEDVIAIDTTCPETVRRYQAARELAGRVDAMVVIGSRTSANTNRLAEVCRADGAPTFHVAAADEIDELELSGFSSIGLTAGASTPDSVVDEVCGRLRSLD